MGWRDISMNRRRPQPNYAVIPDTPGIDRTAAVHRKAAGKAIRAAAMQLDAAGPAGSGPFADFVAGYLIGYARQATTKYGAACDEAEGGDAMIHLVQEIAAAIPPAWALGFGAAHFQPGMQGVNALTRAGYLVGHLEAVCGSSKLVAQARGRIGTGKADAAQDFLLDCDVAADRMQTHFPTLNLRFGEAERELIRRAFAPAR